MVSGMGDGEIFPTSEANNKSGEYNKFLDNSVLQNGAIRKRPSFISTELLAHPNRQRDEAIERRCSVAPPFVKVFAKFRPIDGVLKVMLSARVGRIFFWLICLAMCDRSANFPFTENVWNVDGFGFTIVASTLKIIKESSRLPPRIVEISNGGTSFKVM